MEQAVRPAGVDDESRLNLHGFTLALAAKSRAAGVHFDAVQSSLIEILDAESLRKSIAHHLMYTLGKDSTAASQRDWLYAMSMAVRDRLVSTGADQASYWASLRVRASMVASPLSSSAPK